MITYYQIPAFFIPKINIYFINFILNIGHAHAIFLSL